MTTTDAVPVPPAVAAEARAALAERDRRQSGGTRDAVLAAIELAAAPVVPVARVREVDAWHRAHPDEANGHARTLLAGLWGGSPARDWSRTVLQVRPAQTAATDAPAAAGVAVIAEDTGRVLLLQRALDDDDPASGRWEFPGGKVDPGEGVYETALREFAEEVGIEAPGELAGGWRSDDGVYQCFVHAVPTEADVTCNVDPEDREVLNPDDPDHDNIEVVAWWAIDDADGNPVLRDEVREQTPWDQLRRVISRTAAISGPLPILRKIPQETREDSRGDLPTTERLRRLSGRLAAIDSDLRARMIGGAQTAVSEAMRQAGVKLATRARNRSASARAALDQANHHITPAVLAAVGVTEAELLDKRFDAFAERVRAWTLDAQHQRLQAIATETDADLDTLESEWRARGKSMADQAALLAASGLAAWARQLLADPEPRNDRGEQPLDATLPLGVLRPALMAAEGRPLAGPGSDGPGALTEGELRTPPAPGIALELVASTTTTPVQEVLTWRHGNPVTPFLPHLELDGTSSTYESLEVDWSNDGDWPPEAFYYPGDHPNCSCSWETSYEPVGETGE